MREEISGMGGDINALRTEMGEGVNGLREDARESAARLENLFGGMTNAILDAMNRQMDRYRGTNSRVDDLQARVETLENPAGEQA